MRRNFITAKTNHCHHLMGGQRLRNFFLCTVIFMMAGCASSGMMGGADYVAVADESFLIYKEAERAFKSGDFELAKKNYEDFTTRFSDDVLTKIAYYYLGRSYEELGGKDDAREIYRKVIDLYPDDFWAESAMQRIQILNN